MGIPYNVCDSHPRYTNRARALARSVRFALAQPWPVDRVVGVGDQTSDRMRSVRAHIARIQLLK